jgi:chromosome segregation ATPase
MALSYYEDLVSAMNVLYSMALKYSASYAPQVKQSNLLKTHYENVGRAVSSVMARLEEAANERKRSRGGTPPVHALSLMPPSQQSLPSEMVHVLKQIAEVGQTIAEAKRPRPEAKETDARIRDLEKELDITKATHEAEAKHGSKLAAQASSFQAQQDKLKEKLHQVEMENAKMQASIDAKAEMQVELTKVNQAHLESSNTASCFRGAMMMQSCTSFGAGGSSQQVMGAHQGWAALLAQSASGGFGSSLPMMAPRNRSLQELKGPADETSPMPPRVAQEVQELITEVERAIQVCSANQNFDVALALQNQGRAIKQTVEEIAVLDANLIEFKRVNAFEEAATTFRQLDEAVTKLNQQKDAVRKTLSQLF